MSVKKKHEQKGRKAKSPEEAIRWDKYFNIAGLDEGPFGSIIGYASESIAIGRALQCGFNLFFKAWRDSKYDAVLDFKKKLFRIEIKGTKAGKLPLTSGWRSGIQVDRTSKSKTKILEKEDADFLIGVNALTGACYIVPVEFIEIISQRSISLNKISIFKEKWNIFKGVRRKFTSEELREGFLNKKPKDLRQIIKKHGIQTGKLCWHNGNKTKYTPKQRLILCIWLFIYKSIK